MENLSRAQLVSKMNEVCQYWYDPKSYQGKFSLRYAIINVFEDLKEQKIDFSEAMDRISKTLSGHKELLQTALVDLMAMIRYCCIPNTYARIGVSLDESYSLFINLYLGVNEEGETVLCYHAGLRYCNTIVTSEHFKLQAVMNDLPNYLFNLRQNREKVNNLVASIIQITLQTGDLCLFQSRRASLSTPVR